MGAFFVTPFERLKLSPIVGYFLLDTFSWIEMLSNTHLKIKIGQHRCIHFLTACNYIAKYLCPLLNCMVNRDTAGTNIEYCKKKIKAKRKKEDL